MEHNLITPYLKEIKDWVILDKQPNREYIEEYLPPGWKQLAGIFGWYLEATKQWVSRIEVRKGLLRITFHTDSNLNKLIADGITRKSSMLCMICGERGNRRFHEEGWPSLCVEHYIQYANYLDDQKSGTETR